MFTETIWSYLFTMAPRNSRNSYPGSHNMIGSPPFSPATARAFVFLVDSRGTIGTACVLLVTM